MPLKLTPNVASHPSHPTFFSFLVLFTRGGLLIAKQYNVANRLPSAQSITCTHLRLTRTSNEIFGIQILPCIAS
jgi:hypothetical protein